MTKHSAPIADRWPRIGRTCLQVGAALASLAPAYPAIRQAVDEPLANLAAVGWIGTSAAIVAGLMTVPSVNALLARIRLGAAPASVADALDSETRAFAALQAPAYLTADGH